MRSRTSRRLACAVALAGVVSVGSAGCNIRLTSLPRPSFECPTEADDDRLGELLPDSRDDVELAMEVETLALKYIDAGAYCAEAAEALR